MSARYLHPLGAGHPRAIFRHDDAIFVRANLSSSLLSLSLSLAPRNGDVNSTTSVRHAARACHERVPPLAPAAHVGQPFRARHIFAAGYDEPTRELRDMINQRRALVKYLLQVH